MGDMKRIQIELMKMKAVSWMKITLAIGRSDIVTEKVSELGRYSNENHPK